MTINRHGHVTGTRFANSVIHSKLRMSYHQALAALESEDDASFPEWGMDKDTVRLIKRAGAIADQVRKQRFGNGALHIDLPQSSINIGKDGKIASIDPVVQDPAHQLIEEFMILANEAVSRHVAENQLPQIYRIHEDPDPEKLAELESMFIEAGMPPGNLNAPRALSKLLIKIADLPQAHLWFMKALRSLKRAVYSTSREGHFGLAKDYYCHFTSPMRRYPDLIMHRIMKGLLLNNRNVITQDRMDHVCFQCSERETRALEAEREIIDQKKIRFFQEQLEADKAREFKAIITEVSNHGMTVELPEAQSFGMIHLSHLEQDFFHYNDRKQELKGRRTGIVYRPGDKINVVIVRVDPRRRFLDFAPSGLLEDNPSGKVTKVKGRGVGVSGSGVGDSKNGKGKGPRKSSKKNKKGGHRKKRK